MTFRCVLLRVTFRLRLWVLSGIGMVTIISDRVYNHTYFPLTVPLFLFGGGPSFSSFSLSLSYASSVFPAPSPSTGFATPFNPPNITNKNPPTGATQRLLLPLPSKHRIRPTPDQLPTPPNPPTSAPSLLHLLLLLFLSLLPCCRPLYLRLLFVVDMDVLLQDLAHICNSGAGALIRRAIEKVGLVSKEG